MGVWRSFEVACKVTRKQAISYSKFVELWEQFNPNLVVAKPMTDICLTCQQNTTKLLRAANLPDNDKSDCVREQQEHLNLALTERNVYKEACNACGDFKTSKDSKGSLKACFHVVGTILRVCEVAITITENQVDG